MSVEQHLCVYCRSPQPHRKCKYCPSYRDALKVNEDVIRELRLKLLGFQELQLEHFRLEKQHQRLQQKCDHIKDVHYQLWKVYRNQIELIEKLKTVTIEKIGKIDFVLIQTIRS